MRPASDHWSLIDPTAWALPLCDCVTHLWAAWDTRNASSPSQLHPSLTRSTLLRPPSAKCLIQSRQMVISCKLWSHPSPRAAPPSRHPSWWGSWERDSPRGTLCQQGWILQDKMYSCGRNLAVWSQIAREVILYHIYDANWETKKLFIMIRIPAKLHKISIFRKLTEKK